MTELAMQIAQILATPLEALRSEVANMRKELAASHAAAAGSALTPLGAKLNPGLGLMMSEADMVVGIPNRQDVLDQLAREGYWDASRTGDNRYCGLFTRLAAYRMNQTGDPSSFGWLTKSGGEEQSEGYAVDAIVYGNDPNDLHNVIDLIGGAGAPNGSLAWQEKPRRASNVWVRPVPLSNADMRYLRPGGGEQPPPPQTPPPPTATCQFQPVNVAPLTQAIDEIRAQVAAVLDEQGSQRAAIDQARMEAVVAKDVAQDLRNVLTETGLQIDASARFLGKISGTVRLPKGE